VRRTRARKRAQGRKRARGLGAVLTRQLRPLRDVADILNEERLTLPYPGLRGFPPEARARVTAFVEKVIAAMEAGGTRAPYIPEAAGRLFQDIADGVTLRYTTLPGRSSPETPDVWRNAVIPYLWYSNPWGALLRLLVDYAESAERERLRRCTQCARWFVDPTRNKSARRCSRACTTRWWNQARRLSVPLSGPREDERPFTEEPT
jgi:hypothetical protein